MCVLFFLLLTLSPLHGCFFINSATTGYLHVPMLLTRITRQILHVTVWQGVHCAGETILEVHSGRTLGYV